MGIQAASSSFTTASGTGADVEELEASDWSVAVEETSDWLLAVTTEILKML
jgi:hypothetical protein